MIRARYIPARVLLVGVLAGALAGCSPDLAERAACEAGDGQVSIAWQPLPGIDTYRVFRANDGMDSAPIAEVDGGSYVDAGVHNGTRYGYIVRAVVPDGVKVPDLAACAVVPGPAGGGDAPASVADLTCRAKSGKVDLAWTPVDGAISYRVLRSSSAAPFSLLGEVAVPPFVDASVMDGTAYEFSVVAVGPAGAAASPSTACTARPGATGGGEPPPPVADLQCRGKRDKLDATWSPVAGAAYYRVYRSVGGVASVAGEVANPTFADFGLPVGVEHRYAVRAVAADGTESADSTGCVYTPADRDGGNRPPQITSAPQTSALESHIYDYPVIATDPEGDAITFSAVVAPSGMSFDDEGGGHLVWSPTADQVGQHTVELRATDARGAYTTQAFVVSAADFNEPPQITSVPGAAAQVGQPYRYDVVAFDPEGGALAYAFAEPAPSGMTIDPATGSIAWQPSAAATNLSIAVRASDAAGAFDTQTYRLDVTRDPLALSAPQGEFSVAVGDTLELRFVSNYPDARYLAIPLPANATQNGDVFRFTPQAGQGGRYEVLFKARFAGLNVGNHVVINVTEASNAAPAIAPLGPFTVAEGGTLRFAVQASDPDGDAVSVTAPGLGLGNAIFDEFSQQLTFQPSYDQAGSYEIHFEASDGKSSAQAVASVTVSDAEAPTQDLELTVNPPQSPTFVQGQTISGSVIGEVASTTSVAAPLVTGLAPTNVQQGRTAQIAITGHNTSFAQGETSATFGDGVTVDSLAVSSPTQAVANVSVSTTAAVGIRQMRVRSGGQEIPSVVAFRVEKGAAIVRGRLTDSFTGEPLVGVRVTVNGTGASAVTGADGAFEIEGVPGGQQTLVAVAPNFEVLQFAIALEDNVTYDIDQPIALDALARPARPGGSLPRAQTLASVLDRGASSVDQPMSQEQAELVISDTLIAVGLDQFGVTDESGAQLNPNITGPGMLSLTPAAVTYFAERMTRGETYTLGQLASFLRGAFSWAVLGLDEDAQIQMLQEAADDAWGNASDPGKGLALVIFNQAGTTLSTSPPVLTRETKLNSFQSFLLVSSFLVRMFPIIDMAIDARLQSMGIDPRTLIEQKGIDPDLYGAAGPPTGSLAVTRIAAQAAGWAGVVGDLTFGAAAQAQTGGTETPGIFSRFGNGAGAVWNGLGSAFVSGSANVLFAVGIAGLLAVLGLAAPAAALSVLGVFLVGFVTTLIAKFVGGFFSDPNLPARYRPTPPAIVSQVDPTVDEPNFYLRFRRADADREADSLRRANPDLGAEGSIDVGGWLRSAGDVWKGEIDKRLLEHRYALWKFTCNPDDPACQASGGASIVGREPLARDSFVAPVSRAEIDNDPLIPDPRGIVDGKPVYGGEFEQFRVLKTRLSEGTNYFKIQTIQFYRRIWSGNNPDDTQIAIPYADVGLPNPVPYTYAPSTGIGSVDAFRGNGIQEGSKLLRRGLGLPFKNLAIQDQADQLDVMLRIARERSRIATEMESALFTATGERTLSIGAEEVEQKAANALGALKAKIQPISPRIQAHRTLTAELEYRLRQTGQPVRTVPELLTELTNPATAQGDRVNKAIAESPTGTGRGDFERYITAKTGEYRLGLAETRHNDAILALKKVRTELAARVQAAGADFQPIDLGAEGRVELPGRVSVSRETVGRAQISRGALTVGPLATAEEADAALARIDAEVVRQQGEIQRIANIRGGADGTWKAGYDERVSTFEKTFYDAEAYAHEMEQFELQQRRFTAAQEVVELQKQSATAETRIAAMRNWGIPAGTPRGFRAGLSEAFVQRNALVKSEGYLKGVKGSFGLNTANVVGVALEVGNEISSLRSSIDVVASPLSNTILVTAHTLPPDPETGKARIEVTSSPAQAPNGGESAIPIPVASLDGAKPEPELPQVADGVARGALALANRPPLAIDDAGNPVIGGAARAAKLLRRASFTGPAGLPIQFETDPDPARFLAVLYPGGPPASNPKDGFLFRDYPFSPPEAELFGAGFPSELIAVDSKGRIYLENYNSNQDFGGRVFRYAGEPAVREHVGSVGYFSQTLMYANPVAPIAMEIGDSTDPTDGRVEDLYIVNHDLGVYLDAGRTAVNRVLKLPVHQADTLPFYADGQNRNRLVAQPWAEHPDFKFDGPTDLEVDARDPAMFEGGERPLYLSDADSLYVLRDPDHDGTAQVTKIAAVPGRIFSGIASDTNGNLYVADYASGEVYLIPQQLLDGITSGAQSPFSSTEDLDQRAYLIKVGLSQAGDIELDTYGHRYIVSTPDGLQPFDIPAVGRLPAGIAEIRVDALGIELPVTTRLDRGNVFMMGANSEGTFAGKQVRIRVRRIDGETGESTWETRFFRTELAGATVLRDDALVQGN